MAPKLPEGTKQSWGWKEVEELENTIVISNPPSGCYKIVNIWRNQAGNIEYTWEDVPVE